MRKRRAESWKTGAIGGRAVGVPGAASGSAPAWTGLWRPGAPWGTLRPDLAPPGDCPFRNHPLECRRRFA